MVGLYNIHDEYSGAWRTSIDDIDDGGSLNYKTNQGVKYNGIEADPIAEEEGERESVHVESKDIYVGRLFVNKGKVFNAYSSYALEKWFGIYGSKTTKSKIDQNVILMRYFL